MKKTLSTMVLIAASLFTFASCNPNSYKPDAKIQQAFKAKYPQAAQPKWEQEKGYYVAEFNSGGIKMEARFDNTGKWLMTESDISFKNVPDAIKNSFNTGEYKGWKQESLEKIERAGVATVYIIEIEQGEQEMDLYYAEDGKLIKSVAGNNDAKTAQLPVTPEIQSLVAQKYPNATIINIDDESGFTEIDIIDGGVQKEILADSQNNWVSTSWNIWPNDVVAIVMDALKNSPYASYQIDEIDFIETPASSYYLFDLEQGENDLQIMIDLNGNITGK